MNKRRLVVGLALTTLMLSGVVLLPAVPARAVTLDGGFETSGAQAQWAYGFGTSATNTVAYSGSWSAVLNNNSSALETISTWDTSQGYYFWAKSSDITRARLSVKSGTVDCMVNQSIPQTWTQYFCPAGASSATIRFSKNDGANGVPIWIDDATLGSNYSGPATPMYTTTIYDGTFEDGGANWNYGYGTSATNTVAHNGSWSASLGANTSTLETTSTWNSSAGYYFWARSSDSTRARLDVRSGTVDCFVRQSIPQTWTQYFCPAGASSGTIRFSKNDGANGVPIWIDDVTLGSNFNGPASVIFSPTITDSTQKVIDTWISSTSPTTNLDGQGKQDIGYSSYISRTLMWFKSLSTLPVGIDVNSATLRLTVYTGSAASNASTLRAYRVKRNWLDTTATWNQAESGVNWETPGASGATDIDAADIGSVAVPAVPVAWSEINLPISAATVKGWAIGTYTNYGFLLKVDTENVANRVQYFEARYGGNYERPALSVSVQWPAPTATPTATDTPVPPTATDTPVPPTATATPTHTATTAATDTPTPTATATPYRAVTSGAVTFVNTTLTGQAQTVNGSTGVWEISNTFPAGTGWHVTLAAGDFISGTHTIGAGQMSLQIPAASLTTVSGGPLPATNVETWTPLSNTAQTILSAGGANGIGTYQFTPGFRLILPADAYAGTYTSALTVTIIAGP